VTVGFVLCITYTMRHCYVERQTSADSLAGDTVEQILKHYPPCTLTHLAYCDTWTLDKQFSHPHFQRPDILSFSRVSLYHD